MIIDPQIYELEFNEVQPEGTKISIAGLKPVQVKDLNGQPFVQTHSMGTLEDLMAEEERLKYEQRKKRYVFERALKDYTYDEVVEQFGTAEGFYPCDGIDHQCSLLCSAYGPQCPYIEKPKEEKKDENLEVQTQSGRNSNNNRGSRKRNSKRKKSK